MDYQLIWTRAAEDIEADKPLLDGTPCPWIHIPCLATKPQTWTWPEEGSDVVAIASRTTVDCSLADLGLRQHLARQKKIYTFGEKTAAALQQLRLPVERVDVPDGLALANWMATNLDPKTRVVFCGAQEPAYDIVGHLAAQGFTATHVPVYSTTTPTAWPEERALRTLTGHNNFVCFASPSAVRGFVSLFASVGELLPAVHAVAIGETTARVCAKHFRRVSIADAPSLEHVARKANELIREAIDQDRHES